MKKLKKTPIMPTLTSKHKELIDEIENQEKTIPDLELERDNLINQQDKSHLILKQIDDLNNKIEDIKSMKMNYYVKNAHLIFDYNMNTINITIDSNKNCKSKKDCLNEYLLMNDKNYQHLIIKESNVNDTTFCSDCNVFRKLKECEALLICPLCGVSKTALIEHDKPSIKDPPPETRNFFYKKFGHFCSWLLKIQGKECCKIPQEVYDTIKSELSKEHIVDFIHVDEKKIKLIFKKYNHLGYKKYNNHIIHILMNLSGISPINLTIEQEKQYKYLFLEIQDLWEKYKPENRDNMGSYAFLIFKFAQLLSHAEVMKRMKLLKCKSKLHNLDTVWRQICNHKGGKAKGWEYFASY